MRHLDSLWQMSILHTAVKTAEPGDKGAGLPAFAQTAMRVSSGPISP